MEGVKKGTKVAWPAQVKRTQAKNTEGVDVDAIVLKFLNVKGLFKSTLDAAEEDPSEDE